MRAGTLSYYLGMAILLFFSILLNISSYLHINTCNRVLNAVSSVVCWGSVGGSPHQQAILRHQLGVLLFNSILTLSTPR